VQTILGLFDAVGAGWNTVRSIIEGLFAAVTGLSSVVFRALAATLDGLAALGAPVQWLADHIRAAHGLLAETSRQATDAMIRHATEASEQGERAWGRLVEALTHTGEAARGTAEAVTEASRQIGANLDEGQRAALESATGLTEQERMLAEQLADMDESADAAAGGLRGTAAAASAAGAAAGAADDALAKLRAQLDALAGDAAEESLSGIALRSRDIAAAIDAGDYEGARQQIEAATEALSAWVAANQDAADDESTRAAARQFRDLLGEIPGAGAAGETPVPTPRTRGEAGSAGSAGGGAPRGGTAAAPVQLDVVPTLRAGALEAIRAEIAAISTTITVDVLARVVGGTGGTGTGTELEREAAADGDTPAEAG
jgi:hypothetical protein